MADDCDAPQSRFATFKDWSEYKEACEKTCEKMPTIFCERHSHGDHEHGKDILTERFEEAKKEKARIKAAKRAEQVRIIQERRERDRRMEEAVRSARSFEHRAIP